MADKQYKTIVDHIGRTVIGNIVKEDAKALTLNNPVIIHVQPDQESGQLQVQSFPYIFMEFLKDKEQNNWTFNKTVISVSDVELDDKIITQYENINNPQPPIAGTPPAEAGEPEVVKLFDDEEDEAPAAVTSDTTA
jgi:hypothetical protein|tara:strand:- start:903 stop:1310 length:408 start_codon:yes stop_codon:yes gene_type:complete